MASTSYCDITSLRVALVQHAAEIAIRVLGEPNLRLCGERELRFGNRGSLAVAIDGPKAGQWYDHENDEGGDLIDLGYAPGPLFSRILSAVEDAQLEGSLFDREQALSFVLSRFPILETRL